ncbi:MAG: DUF4124 domain-containing protein [Burkholderiales bacterium]|nr:DUF4124 domain-containing protein [Burkholderiales bacterium]
MKKLVCCGLLWSLCWAAHAAYKCEVNGSVIYSDQPCAAGKSVHIAEPPKPSVSNVTASERKLAREKAEIKRLESARQKREAREEKTRMYAERREVAMQKKCGHLAQRKKWAEEDAARSGSFRARETAKTKARRAAERYDLECRR